MLNFQETKLRLTIRNACEPTKRMAGTSISNEKNRDTEHAFVKENCYLGLNKFEFHHQYTTTYPKM